MKLKSLVARLLWVFPSPVHELALKVSGYRTVQTREHGVITGYYFANNEQYRSLSDN